MDQGEIDGIKEVLRDLRDKLLKDTDLWGLSDFPASQAQLYYRQGLRDITDQVNFPENIEWPIKPE